MCGICGIIHFDRERPVPEAQIRALNDTSPTADPTTWASHYLQDNVALGHRRLSIIDFERGHQPMTNETAR